MICLILSHINQNHSYCLENNQPPDYIFQASVTDAKFYDVFNNLQKFHSKKPFSIVQNDELNIKTTNLGSDANIFIDFTLKSKDSTTLTERVQYDVFKQKVFKHTKTNSEYVDVIHFGIEYRIGVSFKLIKELDMEDFLKMNLEEVQTCQMKNTRSWNFQFMVIDLTSIFGVYTNKPHFSEFFNIIKNYIDTGRNITN